jgi:excisionase family DNA binding protein
MEALIMTKGKFTDPAWDDVPAMLSTEEVSTVLRVHVNTVKKLITEGKIPAYKVGRAYRINKADLMRYMGLIDR